MIEWNRWTRITTSNEKKKMSRNFTYLTESYSFIIIYLVNWRPDRLRPTVSMKFRIENQMETAEKYWYLERCYKCSTYYYSVVISAFYFSMCYILPSFPSFKSKLNTAIYVCMCMCKCLLLYCKHFKNDNSQRQLHKRYKKKEKQNKCMNSCTYIRVTYSLPPLYATAVADDDNRSGMALNNNGKSISISTGFQWIRILWIDL